MGSAGGQGAVKVNDVLAEVSLQALSQQDVNLEFSQ